MYALFSLDLPFLKKQRLHALIGGALGTLFWIALLRFAIPMFVRVKGISWILIALTIVWVGYSQRRLSKARDLAIS
jgi:hypothetical protein